MLQNCSILSRDFLSGEEWFVKLLRTFFFVVGTLISWTLLNVKNCEHIAPVSDFRPKDGRKKTFV